MKRKLVIAVALVVIIAIAVFTYISKTSKSNITPPGANAGVTTNSNTGSGVIPASNPPAATAKPNNIQNSPSAAPSAGSAPVAVKNTGSLKASDFSITDGKETISLDSSFKNFKTSSEELAVDDHADGEVMFNNVTYKYFVYRYNDFNLYTSNAHYDLKKRNAEDQYISNIILKNQNYRTPRGVGIGSDLESIKQAYGEGRKTFRNDKACIVYQLNDMELAFSFDGPHVVGMSMQILVGAYKAG